MFDVAQTRTLVEYQQHAAPVAAVAFSPDGRRLYSVSADGQLCIYDVERAYLPVRYVFDLVDATGRGCGS